MKKQIMVLGIFFIFIVVSLIGCIEEQKKDNKEITNDESVFIGKWVVIGDLSNRSIGDIYTFYENGTLEIIYAEYQDGEDVTYYNDFKLENNKLCIKPLSDWSCFEYEFFNKNSFVIFLSGAMTLEKFDGYTSSPMISFDVNTTNSNLTVNYVDQSTLNWEDFEIIGNAVIPSGQIDVGDVITNCSDNILIRHISSNAFQGTWVFPSTG